MALAAGLSVVKRAEPVIDILNRVKGLLVAGVGRLVHHSVSLAVETSGGFAVLRKQRASYTQTKEPNPLWLLHRRPPRFLN